MQEVPVAASETVKTFTLQGSNLTAITALQAVVDADGQVVAEITFEPQQDATDESADWEATIAPEPDRSADATYNVQFIHGSPATTVGDTEVTLKVAAAPAP